MPLSKVIRHIDTSTMDIRPFALAEEHPHVSSQSDREGAVAKIIRAAETAGLRIVTFLSSGSAPTAEQNAVTTLAVVSHQAASVPPAVSGEHHATQEAQEMLPATPPAHAVLLQQAQAEAERCLAEARERAAATEAAGYSAGHQQGEAAARTDMQAQFASVFASLQKATQECASLRQDVLHQAEDDIVTLVFHLARKVIQHEALCDRDIVATSLRRALACVMEREQVTVRVNPLDLERALQLKEDLLHTVQGLRHLSIEGDAMVGPGGCLVESTFGEIDARLEAQIEELEQRFREHNSLRSEASVS
jgi:flagellar biosynthesis/type III secretory pathway protein FliH